MLSQIFANASTGARTGDNRRKRKASFPARLSRIFGGEHGISFGVAPAGTPKRRTQPRRALLCGTLFYLAGIAFVGAIIVGVFFGIGLYSLAHSTEEAGAGLPALQPSTARPPDGIAAAPPESAASTVGSDPAAAPADRLSSKPTAETHFAAASSETVSGIVVDVVDAMTWVVANSTIRLWGIRPGPTGTEPSLARFVEWARAGGPLDCHKHARSSRYQCATATGEDIAKAALLAGVGRAAEGAPAAYRNAEAQARRNGKGLWAGP